MPRQDVPYGGAICRLKERIAEIWDELGKKLHSINGVEGDAAGDVKIVSGDAAITISESQVGHYIEIGLDHGELPSAAVQSVNGRTGDVILHSSDIGADGGVSVQGAIDNLSTRVTTNGSAITQEVIDRQNADAALQGNINTVQASIPGAAATAVANDPTVTQLATDVPNKLDKITSGSTLKAYTHTGATQGETAISSGADVNSIGLRDANGRMYAADPASGATDKTLVTANWVSQTGDGGPNNLLHKTGTETKTGTLILTRILYGATRVIFDDSGNTSTANRYKMIAKWSRVYSFGTRNHLYIDCISRQRERAPDEMILYCNNNVPLDLTMIHRGNYDNITYVLSYDSDYVYLWLLTKGNPADYDQVLLKHCTENVDLSAIQTITNTERYQDAPIGTEVRRLTP